MSKSKSLKIVIVIESIAIIALVVLLILKGLSLNGEKIGQAVVKNINDTYFGGEETAVFTGFENVGKYLYKINIEVQEQEQPLYVTKDGEYGTIEIMKLKPSEPVEIPEAEKPEVDLFVMSFCPFGNQAEEMMMPVANLLKDKIDIEVHYIFYSDYASGYPEYCLDEENKYCSMHGIQELNQGIRELCVWKYEKDKFWDFLQEINAQADSTNVDDKWENIAKGLGIDTVKIKECQENEGMDIAEEEVALTSKLYPVQNPEQHRGEEEANVSGSPTLLINGVIYGGGRSANDYKEAICDAFNTPPAECEKVLEEDVEIQGSC